MSADMFRFTHGEETCIFPNSLNYDRITKIYNVCSKPSTRKTKLRRIKYEKNKCVTIDSGRNDCGYLCGVDLLYQCVWLGKWRYSGKNLGGTYHPSDFYAGGNPGTVCGMSAQ